MSVKNPLLEYSNRSYGMDHDRYPWSMLKDRRKVEWPNGKKIALWVNVSLQYFPVAQTDKTFPVPGGMRMPYPDLRHFSLRDYGNRVGIYRILKILDENNVRPTIAMNASIAENYPSLTRRIVERDYEIIAHGIDMDTLHHSEIELEVETERVKKAVTTLRSLTGQPIKGWLSPGKSQSFNTPELLVDNEIEYMCDWVNDELPYVFHTSTSSLINLPLNTELEDSFILLNNLHSIESYVDQVKDAMAFLRKEANEKGGRMLALSIHPWLMGQPHRIKHFKGLIETLVGYDDVWAASGSEIIAAASL